MERFAPVRILQSPAGKPASEVRCIVDRSLSVIATRDLGVEYYGCVDRCSYARAREQRIFESGLLKLIGLSARNAMLIVVFARKQQKDGDNLTEAIIKASRLTLLPIVLTSLDFTLGIVPFLIATGAGSELIQRCGEETFA
ncbi:efflux RND transporter permease subunit [Agrobacterium sp. CG674]